jgi:hypothetical protein
MLYKIREDKAPRTMLLPTIPYLNIRENEIPWYPRDGKMITIGGNEVTFLYKDWKFFADFYDEESQKRQIEQNEEKCKDMTEEEKKNFRDENPLPNFKYRVEHIIMYIDEWQTHNLKDIVEDLIS